MPACGSAGTTARPATSRCRSAARGWKCMRTTAQKRGRSCTSGRCAGRSATSDSVGQFGFSRYRRPTGSEAETEPGSRGRVLRNRPGIRRKRDMDAAEYEALLRTQEAYLEQISAETRFTAALIRQ